MGTSDPQMETARSKDGGLLTLPRPARHIQGHLLCRRTDLRGRATMWITVKNPPDQSEHSQHLTARLNELLTRNARDSSRL